MLAVLWDQSWSCSSAVPSQSSFLCQMSILCAATCRHSAWTAHQPTLSACPTVTTTDWLNWLTDMNSKLRHTSYALMHWLNTCLMEIKCQAVIKRQCWWQPQQHKCGFCDDQSNWTTWNAFCSLRDNLIASVSYLLFKRLSYHMWHLCWKPTNKSSCPNSSYHLSQRNDVKIIWEWEHNIWRFHEMTILITGTLIGKKTS